MDKASPVQANGWASGLVHREYIVHWGVRHISVEDANGSFHSLEYAASEEHYT